MILLWLFFWLRSTATTLVVLVVFGSLTSGYAQSWTSQDVGAVGMAGTDSYNGATGTYTLTGSGSDIWGNADAFHFVYQTLPGDGELTAQVVSIQNINAWTKAGVMIRQNLTAGSIQAMIAFTPGNGAAFEDRTVAQGVSSNSNISTLGSAGWLKIIKDANIVTTYVSKDAINWTLMGFVQLAFSGPVDIGLALSSHNNSKLASAVFNNITLISTPKFAAPSPWLDGDIGGPALTGGIHYENSMFSIYGGGVDIWGTADQFHYVYQPLNGDGWIITQVSGQTNPNAWSKAGVMIRQDLTPGSPQVMAAVSPGHGVVLQTRLSLNATSNTTSGPALTTPVWLKLLRSGYQIYVYESSDGVNWQQFGQQTLILPQSVYIGLVECSHNSNALGLALFNNVQTGPPILALNSLSDTSFNLVWPSLADPNLVAQYEIDRNGVKVGTSLTTSYEDIQLTPSTTYTYLIKALGASGNVLASTQLLTVTTQAPFLPAPWTHLDIGNVQLGGYTKLDSTTGIFTEVGSGSDIWGNADAFQFAEQSLTGDGEVIARVKSITPTNPWSKAGIMLRTNNTPGSPNVLLTTSASQGVQLQQRTTNGGSTANQTFPLASGPIWLKLIRQGNVVTGLTSSDGMNWISGGSTTVALGATVEAGLAVTSHAVNGLATAVMDNVSVHAGIPVSTTPPTTPGTPTVVSLGDVSASIQWDPSQDTNAISFYQIFRNGQQIATTGSLQYTDTGLTPGQSYIYSIRAVDLDGLISPSSASLGITTQLNNLPSPWSHQEIGALGLAGSAGSTTTSFSLAASGVDIWNSSDSFGFISQAFTGDGQFTAHVASLTNVNPWTKAGIMVRNTLDPQSIHAMMLVSASNGTGFFTRTQAGANTGYIAGPNFTAPTWVRLIRQGNLLKGYSSTDGLIWNQVSQATLNLGSTVNVGLALTSHNNARIANAVFDHVAISPPALIDSDGNGLPDAWEIQYFGKTGNNPNALSPAGDGYTLLQEYQLGRNPLDFYQGQSPVFTIVSGNNQQAQPNTLLPLPLVISVSAPGLSPITNAPITFSVPGGQGQLSADATGNTLSQTINLRVNAQGQAQVYLKLPSVVGASTVTVSGGMGNALSQINFTEIASQAANKIYLFAGGQDSFLLDTSLFGWGSNLFNQLGINQQSLNVTPSTIPGSYLAVVTNGKHSLFLKSDHTVMCSGENYFGELGTGDQADVKTLKQVGGLANVIALATGEGHSLALLQGGTVMSWGSSWAGQLGNGTTTNLTPTLVPGLTNIIAIAAGREHSMALDTSGHVYVWGGNSEGQLGTGDRQNRPTPTLLNQLLNITQISSGDYYCSAIDEQGTVWVWGANSSGELAQGNYQSILIPSAIPGLSKVTAISTGSEHILLLDQTGALSVSGANFSGQLGTADMVGINSYKLLGITGLNQIAAGGDHSMALDKNKNLYVWGDDSSGELGDGTTISKTSPVTIGTP